MDKHTLNTSWSLYNERGKVSNSIQASFKNGRKKLKKKNIGAIFAAC